MKTFEEIETAAKNLPPREREKLARSLSSQPSVGSVRARCLDIDGDRLLEAPAGALAMTPERVKQLLDEFP